MQCATSQPNVTVLSVTFGGVTREYDYAWIGTCPASPDGAFYFRPTGVTTGCYGMLNPIGPAVATVSALTTLPNPAAIGAANLVSYNGGNWGGGAVTYFSACPIAVDGGVAYSTSAGGSSCWKRHTPGKLVYPEWYGADPTGNTSAETATTAAFNAMQSSIATNHFAVDHAGCGATYAINGWIYIPDGGATWHEVFCGPGETIFMQYNTGNVGIFQAAWTFPYVNAFDFGNFDGDFTALTADITKTQRVDFSDMGASCSGGCGFFNGTIEPLKQSGGYTMISYGSFDDWGIHYEDLEANNVFCGWIQDTGSSIGKPSIVFDKLYINNGFSGSVNSAGCPFLRGNNYSASITSLETNGGDNFQVILDLSGTAKYTIPGNTNVENGSWDNGSASVFLYQIKGRFVVTGILGAGDDCSPPPAAECAISNGTRVYVVKAEDPYLDDGGGALINSGVIATANITTSGGFFFSACGVGSTSVTSFNDTDTDSVGSHGLVDNDDTGSAECTTVTSRISIDRPIWEPDANLALTGTEQGAEIGFTTVATGDTITLPSRTGNELFSGRFYKIFSLSGVSANLTVKDGSTTLATVTPGNAVCVAWNRGAPNGPGFKVWYARPCP